MKRPHDEAHQESIKKPRLEVRSIIVNFHVNCNTLSTLAIAHNKFMQKNYSYILYKKSHLWAIVNRVYYYYLLFVLYRLTKIRLDTFCLAFL